MKLDMNTVLYGCRYRLYEDQLDILSDHDLKDMAFEYGLTRSRIYCDAEKKLSYDIRNPRTVLPVKRRTVWWDGKKIRADCAAVEFSFHEQKECVGYQYLYLILRGKVVLAKELFDD